MKKNVLALSISAAIVGLGFAGGAQAIQTVVPGASTVATVSANGVGSTLLVPYYSAQADNKTQINIINTDTVNGKAVKVRFRSAANSDDVFDFQIFLSPGDLWSGEVSQDKATGLAKLVSGDSTCAKPAIKGAAAANLLFKTARLDTTKGTAASMAAATREGYVEIMTMADVRPVLYTEAVFATEVATATANPLYTAIKHGAGGAAPACSGAAWTALDTNIAGATQAAATIAAQALGLTRPTGGLTANWTLLNTVTSSAYGGVATAIALNGTGNVTYWPQSTVTGTPTQAMVDSQTADPLLRTGTPLVAPTNVDLPDLSTPYLGNQLSAVAAGAGVGALTDPLLVANKLTSLLAKTSVTNEFLTTTSFNASTDWTFSMPTRRYNVVYDYVSGKTVFNANASAASAILNAGTIATGADVAVAGLGGATVTAGGTVASRYFASVNASADAARRMVCVNNILPVAYSREEELAGSVVFSPSVAPTLCGEVSVISLNNAASATSNSLLATQTLNDLDVTYREGWMTMQTPGAFIAAAGYTAGLPILGHSFIRAYTGTINIGVAYPHR